MDKTIEAREVISRELEKQGLSYYQLAKAAGCAPRSISYWATGQRKITLDMADKVLKALGMSITIGCDADGEQ